MATIITCMSVSLCQLWWNMHVGTKIKENSSWCVVFHWNNEHVQYIYILHYYDYIYI